MGARPPRGRIALLAGFVLVAAVVAAAYLHTLPYDFVFDDFTSIRDNATLDRPERVDRIWSFRPSRFVVHYSLALNVAAAGRDPAGLRAVNLIVHLVSALLVGWIGRELARRLGTGGKRNAPEWAGIVAALLFAAHPLATQAVTYLIQRTTSLEAMLALGAVAAYLVARRSGSRLGWALSWSFALLAALTKENAAVLPFLMLLLDAILPGPRRGSRLALAPYFLVIPLILFTTQLHSEELGRGAAGFRETETIGRWTYFLTQMVVIPRYLGLAIWPRHQNLDPDVAVHTSFDPAVAGGAALLLSITGLALYLRKRIPLVALGWFWFLIALAPESSIVPIRDVMNEHRTYLPLAGLALAAAGAWASARVPAPVRILVPAAVVLALAGSAHARNRVWADELTLWTDVVAKSPRKPRGFNNLGMALESRGRRPEAEEAYVRAVELDPGYVHARVNLGRIYGMSGRSQESLAVLLDALRLDPGNVGLLNNLGMAWWAVGDTAAAAAAFGRALALSPGERSPRENLERLRGIRP